MLLTWRWICFYPTRPENTEENQPITYLKPRTFANTTVTSKKVKDLTRRLLFCSNIQYDTRGMIYQPLSQAFFCRLQISLTMPNLSFYGQRELSTGLQLQQKVQNHTAISNCCLTRRQVGAKGTVIPPSLDCKYSIVEQKFL